MSVEDVQRFDKEGGPVMAERLLLLWDRKNVSVEGWDGFMFSRGVLVHKRRRWTAAMLMQWHDQTERVYQLESEIRHLRSWRRIKQAIKQKAATALKGIVNAT